MTESWRGDNDLRVLTLSPWTSPGADLPAFRGPSVIPGAPVLPGFGKQVQGLERSHYSVERGL